jgi:hypothetical protein
MAAKRWPASRCYIDDIELVCPDLDRELLEAERLGVYLVPGIMWYNVNPPAPEAMPQEFIPHSVSWTDIYGIPKRGPNFADPWVQGRILVYLRGFLERYADHPRVAATMCNVGLDGERRFCKYPKPGDPCWEAYTGAGLTERSWEQVVQSVAHICAEYDEDSYFHYSGYGFRAVDIYRDAKYAVNLGLNLMSSGLYPAVCNGNSWQVCNPVDPAMSDWQIPLLFSDTAKIALEQSLDWKGDQAASSWMWAASHSADFIHAQYSTLENSVGKGWRTTTERLLDQQIYGFWVAHAPDAVRCQEWGRPVPPYCPELGNWEYNLAAVDDTGQLVFNSANTYQGWIGRSGRMTFQLGDNIPDKGYDVRFTTVYGTEHVHEGEIAREFVVEFEDPLYSIEVIPNLPTPTLTATPSPSSTWTATPTNLPTVTPSPSMTASATSTNLPTATVTPVPESTFTPTPTSTPTHTPTATKTPVVQYYRIYGRVQIAEIEALVDLWLVGPYAGDEIAIPLILRLRD